MSSSLLQVLLLRSVVVVFTAFVSLTSITVVDSAPQYSSTTTTILRPITTITPTTILSTKTEQLILSIHETYTEKGCELSWAPFPSMVIDYTDTDTERGTTLITTVTATSVDRFPTTNLSNITKNNKGGMACMCGMLHDSALLLMEEFMLLADDVTSSSSSAAAAAVAAPVSLSAAIAAKKEGSADIGRVSSYQSTFANTVTSLDLAEPCLNGQAGAFPCLNVNLMAHLPLDIFRIPNNNGEDVPPSAANDVWGWTSSTNQEFVIWGINQGTFFVEVTDVDTPKIVGFLPSTDNGDSLWRDMKVNGPNNDFVFIGAESRGHGMQIFDLKRLLDVTCWNDFYCFQFTPDLVYFGTTDVPIFSTHNVVSNPDTNYIYLVGGKREKKEEDNAPSCSGGLHIVDVSNPLEPQFIGCYSDDGYTHDAQCLVYNGPDTRYVDQEICLCFNADTVTIVDVSDKSNISQLSRTVYEKTGYTHQGWLSSNQKYVIFGDELDEKKLGGPTRTLVLNIEDLRAPTKFRIIFGTTRAIDHNLYIRNAKQQGYGDQFLSSDLIYQSNYQAGLRILQVIDIDTDYDQVNNIQQVGYFDTFPGSDDTLMEGAWSVYPFFKSNLVAISSVEGGLFLVKPNLEGALFTTAPPPPVFENLGIGYCRDSTGSYNGANWDAKSDCFGLTRCEHECKVTDQCIGISWALTPLNSDDNCRAKSLPRCVVYYGAVVAIEKSSGVEGKYTCYRYVKPVPVPTDAPTNAPTNAPTDVPTNTPTNEPTDSPTNAPTDAQTKAPTKAPTDAPTTTPTATPTTSPTTKPTHVPSGLPSVVPSFGPSTNPSSIPSLVPTLEPTAFPTDSKTTTSGPTVFDDVMISTAPSATLCVDKGVDQKGKIKLVKGKPKNCAKIRKKGLCQREVKNQGGMLAEDLCPAACSVACGSQSDPCADEEEKITLVNGKVKSCAKIAKKQFCEVKVKNKGGKEAFFFCPTACRVDGCLDPPPDPCIDNTDYKYKGIKKCKWVAQPNKKGESKLKDRCNLNAKDDEDDTKMISDFCRVSCIKYLVRPVCA